MAAYTTKQRKMLLEYLGNHPHDIFSVTQIIEHFAEHQISPSAIYRNLSGLEELEMIRRISKNGTREAYYQYINASGCKNQIHLHCMKCEKSEHLHMANVEAFTDTILQLEGFEVDKGSTVIYGICKNCR
ncbi:MAG: transcriptional repressor [Lachnospiraceae bacterium]